MAFFLTLFLWAASFVLSQLLAPKPKTENARPAPLGDFSFPTATEGRVIPLIWGTVKIEGPNVVWYGDLREKAIINRVKTGMFSGSKKVTVGYKYFVGIQFALCRGPVDEISQIWIAEKLVFPIDAQVPLTADGSFDIDLPKLFGGDKLGTGGISGTVSWKTGSETQTANTYLTAHQQEGGDTPAYHGTAYATFEQGYVGNSTSISPWAFEIKRLPVGPDLLTKEVNGADANPAYVIYEILTNTEWGLGFPASDIDTGVFETAATTLLGENNGFSFVLDQPREIGDLLEEVQRQIDGVVYLDQSSGKWTLKLARDDYTVATIPLIDESNILEIKDFVRSAWEDTTNYLTLEFTDRSRDYFKTFSLAQDMGNFRIQGVNNKSNMNFPGVKDRTLANDLVWRELRQLSFPLVKSTVIVNREFWDIAPGDVVKWTSTTLDFTELVMRVTRIDMGNLTKGEIELTLVQDVFEVTTDSSFGDPPDSGWLRPSNTPIAIPLADTQYFEAPKAISIRDTDALSASLPYRVWVGAQYQGDGSVEFDLRTTGGTIYETEREIDQFMLIGKLTSAIGPGLTDSTLTVTPDQGDSQAAFLAELPATGDAIDGEVLGNDLTYILKIGSEFMLASSISANSTDVDFETVYRGILDSAPQAHLIDVPVYLLAGDSAGGGIGDRSFEDTDNVSIKLVTRTRSLELSEGDATTITDPNWVTMANRHLKPYPATGIDVNGDGIYEDSTKDLNSAGSGNFDDSVFTVEFVRRDLDEFQENARHLDTPKDQAPSNATTLYQTVLNDAAGTTTDIADTGFIAGGVTLSFDRTTLLAANAGTVPTSIEITITTQHDIDSTLYESRENAIFEVLVEDTELDGLTNLGVAANLADLASINDAAGGGTYTISVDSDKTGGTVRVSVNGGAYNNVILSGAANSGTFTVGNGESIVIRPDGLTYGGRNDGIIILENPSAVDVAYGVFTF